jgi:crossover junction endodeoxyribonuclease RuvC
MFKGKCALKILGIDPGYAILGYGIIEMQGSKFSLIDYGTINTDVSMEMPDRLVQIYSSLMEIIEKYKPDEVAIEELFFNQNTKTALMVSQARGVAILAIANSQLDTHEYTPLQVKQGIVGYGRADKKQVQIMVKNILNLLENPKPDDAADALAIAICHGHTAEYNKKMKSSR